jgi:ankyrin repeat protein
VVWIADWRGVLRLVAEFSDHTEIAQLSRTRLETLNPGATVATGPLSPAVQRQKDLLAQELALVEQQIAEKRNQISVGRAPSGDLLPLQREALSLQRQMAALDATRVDLLSEVLLPSAAPTDSILSIDGVTEEEQRELDRLMELVRNSPDLINSSTRGGPPLHAAAQKGQLAVTRFLIENGADLDLRDGSSNTPLHRAVESGHKAMTEMLLAAGAQDDASGNVDRQPLHLAAFRGFREIIKVLLAAGADVNAASGGGTPLHDAIAGRRPVIDLLLDSGADLEATTPVHYEPAPGYTPLMLAVGYNFPSIAEHLLIRGANVNATNAAGETVLQLAARLETPAQTLRSILERKPDLEARNPRNLTPLQVACLNLNHGTVRILLEAGANPERLLEAGADPNAATTSGATPMHAAALWPPPAVMQKLLDHGGKVDPQDELGNTPLHVAARANYREMVRFLLARGAAVNARNQRGETPLDIATGRTPYQVWPGRGLIEAIDQRTFAAPPSDAYRREVDAESGVGARSATNHTSYDDQHT